MRDFMTLRLLVLALAVLVVLPFPQVVLADAFDDAVAAYGRGDYKTAVSAYGCLNARRSPVAETP